MDKELKDKLRQAISSYNIEYNDEGVSETVKQIIDEDFENNDTIENLKIIFGLIDLTSLNTADNSINISKMVNKVNQFAENFPEMPTVAAICVYPALVSVVKEKLLHPEIDIASVAAGFPSSQTFIEVKIAETSLAVMEGADEIDIVMSVGAYLEDDYVKIFDEISEVKAACGTAKLKVILETGALPSAKDIKIASILAMEAGADFIKTSTGKQSPAATPEAMFVMAEAVKEFKEKSGKMVGLKPAGGISTPDEALVYFSIVNHVLGTAWISPEYFRIGASRLANNLLSEISERKGGEKVSYF